MNTSKQINVIVALIFASIVATGAYTMWDPSRADSARETQLEKTLERGAFLFSQNCRTCHGDSGEGGQRSNRLREAPPLNRPDLQGRETEGGDVATAAKTTAYKLVFNTINCGRVGKAMPTWGQSQGGVLNDEQMRQLTTFITEGTDWEAAKEFALEGFPKGDLHGDAEVPFTLVEAIAEGEENQTIYLSDVSVLAKTERLQFDEEIVVITGVFVPAVEVTRGASGTTAAEHKVDPKAAAIAVIVNGSDTGIKLKKSLTDEKTAVELSSLSGISAGDELKIQDEIVTVGSINSRHYIEVERGVGTTRPEAHTLDAELLTIPEPPEPAPITGSACGQLPQAQSTAEPEPPSASPTITSQGIAWDKTELNALPDVPLTLTHTNNDPGQQHNWALYPDEEAAIAADPILAATEIEGGPGTQTLNFGPLTLGDYYYQCDVHPQMNGILHVVAAGATDATAPDAAAAADPTAAP